MITVCAGVTGTALTIIGFQGGHVRDVDYPGRVSEAVIIDHTSSQLTGAKMNSPEETQVVVTDIQMPFVSMVVFMVKWALAAIPAFLILGGIFLLILFLFSL